MMLNVTSLTMFSYLVFLVQNSFSSVSHAYHKGCDKKVTTALKQILLTMRLEQIVQAI